MYIQKWYMAIAFFAIIGLSSVAYSKPLEINYTKNAANSIDTIISVVSPLWSRWRTLGNRHSVSFTYQKYEYVFTRYDISYAVPTVSESMTPLPRRGCALSIINGTDLKIFRDISCDGTSEKLIIFFVQNTYIAVRGGLIETNERQMYYMLYLRDLVELLTYFQRSVVIK